MENNLKRICLFAAYDNNNIVHDYVVYYVKELSKFADIYYLAECNMPQSELNKLKPYVKEAYAYKHGKYDFGSWQELIYKIGWERLSQYDELILANDSCFAPMIPFEELFSQIDNDSQWDTCGITKNYSPRINSWYLNSYFMVYRKRLFTSPLFKDFINSISSHKDKMDIVVYYEEMFSKSAMDAGFIVKCHSPVVTSMYKDWRKILKNRCCFLKKKSISADCDTDTFMFRQFITKHTSYPLNLIDKYLEDSQTKKALAAKSLKSLIKRLGKIPSWFVEINRKHKRIRLFGIYIQNGYPKGKEASFEDGSIKLIDAK